MPVLADSLPDPLLTLPWSALTLQCSQSPCQQFAFKFVPWEVPDGDEEEKGRKRVPTSRCSGRCLWGWLSLCCEPSFHQAVRHSAIPACTRENLLQSKTVSGGSSFWSLLKPLFFLVSEGVVPDALHLCFASLFQLNQHLFNKSIGMAIGVFLKRTHRGRIVDRQLPAAARLIHCGSHTGYPHSHKLLSAMTTDAKCIRIRPLLYKAEFLPSVFALGLSQSSEVYYDLRFFLPNIPSFLLASQSFRHASWFDGSFHLLLFLPLFLIIAMCTMNL